MKLSVKYKKKLVNNAILNAFTEGKKLQYSVDKCKKIHIGKTNNICPDLKVHENTMKSSDKEKYLGDFISSSGKIRENIMSRREKGFGIVSDILSIISEIPLGKYKVHAGLKLRQAMLINGFLHNSEAWSDINMEEIEMLEDVDELLLRNIFNAHSKTPLEFLHLESGTKPIRFIIASRRLNYLYTILKRNKNELTRRVFEAQKVETTKGDWIELVKQDCETIEEEYNETFFTSMSRNKFKKYVKRKIEKAAFKYLEKIKNKHSKVKHIKYKKLEIQPYILCEELNNEEVNTLFALRSRMTRVKMNFSNQYKNNLFCTLGCNRSEDQQHLLECEHILDRLEDKYSLAEIEYSDIFGTIQDQVPITKIFSKILKIRKDLMEI